MQFRFIEALFDFLHPRQCLRQHIQCFFSLSRPPIRLG
jgi:hypothetical protein